MPISSHWPVQTEFEIWDFWRILIMCKVIDWWRAMCTVLAQPCCSARNYPTCSTLCIINIYLALCSTWLYIVIDNLHIDNGATLYLVMIFCDKILYLQSNLKLCILSIYHIPLPSCRYTKKRRKNNLSACLMLMKYSIWLLKSKFMIYTHWKIILKKTLNKD